MNLHWSVKGTLNSQLTHPSICNHCRVMAAWCRKTLRIFAFFCVFLETDPYGKILKIVFRQNSSRHRLTYCVQISWNVADGKWVKSWVAYLTKKQHFTWLSALASVRIAPKCCQGQTWTMYSECSRFHPNQFTFGFRQSYNRTREHHQNAL